MSYWHPYENNLYGDFPLYNPIYVDYSNNMSYYNGQTVPDYQLNQQYNNLQQQNGYYQELRPSTSGSNSNNASQVTHVNQNDGEYRQDVPRNTGAVRKRFNENKQWGGVRRNFNKTRERKNDEQTDLESNHNENKNRNKSRNYNRTINSRNYYGDKRSNNYRNGDNRNYQENRNRFNNDNINDNNRTKSRRFDGRKFHSNDKKMDAASQRERLEQMLTRRQLECLVCCEKIKNIDKIWTCQQCYLILHLNCTITWAESSKIDNGWRCPACQNICQTIPKQYYCYCGKTTEPRSLPGILPHSCGDCCMKQNRTCQHKCPILCHPGPCPDCNIIVTKSCGCKRTNQQIKCSSNIDIICDSICNKLLECQQHYCQLKCHPGDCGKCNETIKQICYCGKVGRRVQCNSVNQGSTLYSCNEQCGKLLKCGNHYCTKICHDGDCDDCSKDINKIHTCPCGKSELTQTRSSCLDPIPCCDKICSKVLKCGQPSSPHICKARCHEGDCPPCSLTTLVRCRCGHMDKEIPCCELTTKADDARCEKKCTKKRLCGKHRCNQRCCIEIEHICPLPCNHQLSCGQHRCQRTCHSGRCPPCQETSFDELYCECGANVIYPPIPCGTKPPQCNKPCSRQRSCGHDVNHSCHTGQCPPCTVLCKRWCFGKHEQRSAIPCYQEDFSCGLPCGQALPCGKHKCDKPCHLGQCPLPCKQKCTVKRTLCDHPCNVQCHQPPCPNTPCKFNVPITCQCGLQKSTRLCVELIDEYKEIEMANLKDKMTDLMKEQTVDISDIVNKPKKPSVLKILECTEECRVVERNRRFALSLQIRNPDLTQKLTPRYSDFLRQWAKKDPQFCQRIHDKLTELVQLSKQSKQKSRSYSFESMNRDKRQFIHEYCEHFGCESAAYDQEPNRNVVATAIKDKSWLPSMSLLETIQRENGQRKVPGPVLSNKTTTSTSKSETIALKLTGRNGGSSSGTVGGGYAAAASVSLSKETVDYFDNPPQ